MGHKLFISYSHVDKNDREQFQKYLAMLHRQEIVESWTDQEIVVGDEWEKELLQNLRDSDVIVFLVSQDFLSSSYCYEIEMQIAFEMHDAGKAAVVPILIRDCDWQASPISKFQVCPSGAEPVHDWEKNEKAWMDVNKHIRSLIEKIDSIQARDVPPVFSSVEDRNTAFESIFETEFYKWFADTEIALSNPHVDRISFQELYVFPHLLYLTKGADSSVRIVDGEQLYSRKSSLIVVGDEQSGKTSLCKSFLGAHVLEGVYPLFVNARDINDADPSKLVADKYLNKIYQKIDAATFNQQSLRVLLVDDLSDINLNQKYRDIFIAKALEYFDVCVFTANDSFQFIAKEISALDGTPVLEVQPFGYAKRSALIQRWISVGREQTINDEELYSRIDELKLQVDSFIRGNVVPAKPLYVLTVLQMLETFTQKAPDQTTSGYCYEYLILKALEKSEVKGNQIDSYLNILSEYSWHIYQNRDSVAQTPFSIFLRDYKSEFLVQLNDELIVDTLVRSRLMRSTSGVLSFRYPYIYYFFVAKRIAAKISDVDEIREEVSKLIDTLHREDSSNIVIFLSHHSRNPWVLEELQLRLLDSFAKIGEATLAADSLTFMAEFVRKIPDLVIEARDISNERIAADQIADAKAEEKQQVDEYLESDDLFMEINRVIRGIEIVGQIVRNRHGSIQTDTLSQMVGIATDAGLRFLQFFLELTESAKYDIIRLVEHQLQDNPKMKLEELQKEAETAFQFATYSTISAILRKISASVGSREAEGIYRKLESNNPTPAMKLVNEAISLQFTKKVNIDNLKKINLAFKNNPVCRRLLQDIVLQHIYMFPLDFREKQRIAEVLGISVEGQIKMQNASAKLGKDK